jgi:hypothetical protein
MAWYDDKNKRAHIATYKNVDDASREAERAANKGWIISNTQTTQGHINPLKTAVKAVTVVGLVFGGASRTSDTITITYGRSPDGLAKRR